MNTSRYLPILISGCATALIVGAGVYFMSRDHGIFDNHQIGKPLINRSRNVVVGGVQRPVSDIDASRGSALKDKLDQVVASSARPSSKEEKNPFGTTPVLKGNESPAIVALATALKSGSNPERISAMFLPTQFDVQQYRNNPRSYLESVEPGRVWQTAQPGEGVPVLTALVRSSQEIIQGESLRLTVRAVRDAPVTFTSFDLGQFDNRLTSITVAANADGVAEAVLTGTPGTIGDINILAASPFTTGQVHFIVHVKMALRPQSLK